MTNVTQLPPSGKTKRKRGPKAEVVLFNGITKLDLPADRILEQAVGKLDKAVVIGWEKDGEFYFSSSIAGGPEVVWLMELAKRFLLSIGCGEDDVPTGRGA